MPRKELRRIREERDCHSYIRKINENLTRVLLVSDQPRVAAVPVRRDLRRDEEEEVPLVDQDD